jgi:hypothetical protein
MVEKHECQCRTYHFFISQQKKEDSILWQLLNEPKWTRLNYDTREIADTTVHRWSSWYYRKSDHFTEDVNNMVEIVYQLILPALSVR